MKKSALFYCNVAFDVMRFDTKTIMSGFNESDEYNTAFFNDKCVSIVNKNTRHWYMERMQLLVPFSLIIERIKNGI